MVPAPGPNSTSGPAWDWLDQRQTTGAPRRRRAKRLEQFRLENRRHEAMDRIQRTFTYPWAKVAEHTADYRTFGQAEALRIGLDHPSRTQSLVGTRPAPADGLLTAPHLLQVEMTRTCAARPAMVPPGAMEVLSDDAQPIVTRAINRISPTEWESQSKIQTAEHPDVMNDITSFLLGALGADVVHPFSFSAVNETNPGYPLRGAVKSASAKNPTFATERLQGLT